MFETMILVCSVLIIAAIVIFFARNRRYRWFYIIWKTYKRDIRGFIALYKTKKWAAMYAKEPRILSTETTAVAKKNLKKTAIICEGESWTYEMVLHFENKLARFFVQEGFKRGDTIALFMENSIEYPCIWVGLSQVGIVTALINTNLTKSALVHSLTVCKAKGVIFGSNFASTIKDIADSIKSIYLYEYQSQAKISGILKDSCNLKLALSNVSGGDLGKEYEKGQPFDRLIYIYTSGTTGLPKATIMTNMRCLVLTRATMEFMRTAEDFIGYIALPLYHLSGGIYGIVQMFLAGGTTVIAKKFSASNFFKDCDKYNCNSSIYIGEMCRYLLALPEDTPINHKLVHLAGVGLRPHLWSKFVERFKIKTINELYTSTEGVLSLLNLDNTPGSVGYVPRYLFKNSPIKLIKCDETTGEPIRNGNGFCIECGVDEPGLALGRINNNRVTQRFDGYTDEEATRKKLLTNVFLHGDVYLNTGDIFVYDELGNFFIKDRTGDTYRWKGENVSATEIENIISEALQFTDVAVFGVKIPETEGTAGMAAIDISNNNIDFETLKLKLAPLLPSYAIPIFIRTTASIEMTGTFRVQKVQLKAEGFDINKVKDPIYFYDSTLGKYVKLTNELYEMIITGKVRI